jgi:hypothetical protein
MSDAIQLGFESAKAQSTDMQGHMDVLKDYASRSPKIAEFGVYDCTSTWALLAGRPSKLTSYDITRRPEVFDVEKAANECGASFEFVLADSVSVDIGPVDLLLIDSLHTYEHLSNELRINAQNVSQFIILHDTETFGHTDETYTGRGLWPAVEEFLQSNPEWKILHRFTHCHGLTVLTRVTLPGRQLLGE